MKKSTIAIFEEYCDSVKEFSDGELVEVKIRGKYFTELYTRVMLHGMTCLSIMSDQTDNHVATFIEGGTSEMFGDFMGDDFHEDDSGDWWKNQD
tara:strand:+ start:26 stop:307 length:282 start_codon:yes stop_codon:yes gene_type:complete